MTQVVKSTLLVISSLWVGIVVCLGFVVAPYLFALAARRSAAVPNTGVAADLIGPLLYGSDVISLAIGILLIAGLVYLRRRGEAPLGARYFVTELAAGAAALAAAVNYWGLAPRIKAVQGALDAKYGAFHLADRADPLYRQFGALHGTSTLVFLAGCLAALAALVCLTRFQAQAEGPVARGAGA